MYPRSSFSNPPGILQAPGKEELKTTTQNKGIPSAQPVPLLKGLLLCGSKEIRTGGDKKNHGWEYLPSPACTLSFTMVGLSLHDFTIKSLSFLSSSTSVLLLLASVRLPRLHRETKSILYMLTFLKTAFKIVPTQGNVAKSPGIFGEQTEERQF